MSAAPSLAASSANADRIVALGRPRLQVYRSLQDLESLRPAWDALLDEYPFASTFSTWEWLSSWWIAFGKDRTLLLLALLDAESRLLGLAPLSISRERFAGIDIRMLRLMGDGTWDSDNLDCPVVPGYEAVFSNLLLQYLREHKSSWDISELNMVPRESTVVDSLVTHAKSGSWIVSESSYPSSAIPLPNTWNEYLANLSSEDQKNLDRYTRRLQQRYVTRIYRCTEQKDLPRCLDALFRLHQARWESVGQPGSFSSSERRGLYQQLSRALLAKRALELWVMELDAEIAAIQFAFRYKERVFQLQEGYDHTRPSDRVGFVLRGAVLRQLISEGAEVYDFLGGEDPYKARWGAQPGHYRMIRFAPIFTTGASLIWAANGVSKGKQRLRRMLPEFAWNVLRRAKRIASR